MVLLITYMAPIFLNILPTFAANTGTHVTSESQQPIEKNPVVTLPAIGDHHYPTNDQFVHEGDDVPFFFFFFFLPTVLSSLESRALDLILLECMVFHVVRCIREWDEHGVPLVAYFALTQILVTLYLTLSVAVLSEEWGGDVILVLLHRIYGGSVMTMSVVYYAWLFYHRV